ncbi:MAG: hypothetical protein ACK49N_07265 [Verrucomicrobiota bacterium]
MKKNSSIGLKLGRLENLKKFLNISEISRLRASIRSEMLGIIALKILGAAHATGNCGLA